MTEQPRPPERTTKPHRSLYDALFGEQREWAEMLMQREWIAARKTAEEKR